ncbi:unnamed protein product [Phytomonas sp. EM1]|nr:unnamed protein product [Phytomonas sp. EM1]|eukprot:CCW60518.1 unnamed protein product [Phytomonas sp. isolate EM1]
MEAERLVFFRFLHGTTDIAAGESDEANKEEDPVPLMFATSTTSLSATQEAILDGSDDFIAEDKKQDPCGSAPLIDQIDSSVFRRVHLSDACNSIDDRNLYEKCSSWGKTRCGTQVGGLITVLISGQDLLRKSLANHRVPPSVDDNACSQDRMTSLPPPSVSKGHFNNVWISHEIPGTPLREYLSSNSDSPTDEKSLKDISALLRGDACAIGKKDCDPVGLLSSLPCEEKYLFPITALPAEVMSIPEMVNFSCTTPAVHNEKEDGQGTVMQHVPAADDQRENLKSAASTLNACRLAHWAAHLSQRHSSKSSSRLMEKCKDMGENRDVLYRVALVTRQDAVQNVMLGVSQWWLQRPISPHELGYDYGLKENPHEYLTHNDRVGKAEDRVLVPIQLKIVSMAAARVFYVPLKVSLLCRFMAFVCYVHACLAFCFTLCDNAAAATLLPSKEIAEWCSLTPTQSDYSNDAMHRTGPFARADKSPPTLRNFLTSLLFALSIVLAIPLLMLIISVTLLFRVLNHYVGHLYPSHQCTFMRMFSLIKHLILSFIPFEATVCAHGSLQNRLRERASAMETCHWLYRLGAVYSGQLQALDVSHTGICGTHLLAFALGNHFATHGDVSSSPNHVSALRALDVAGCLFLDFHCNASLLQTELDVRRYLGIPCSAARKGLGSDSTTVDEMLACSESLKMLSHAGRALARLCLDHRPMKSGRKHGLQLMNASGSSLDSKVLDELGQCALLYELEAAHRRAVSIKMSDAASGVRTGDPSSEPPLISPAVSPTSSLIAINLTSCRKVRSVNALSYITSLVQILAPFTELNNAGVVHLDGSAFQQLLSRVAKSVCKSNHLRCAPSDKAHITGSKVDIKCGEAVDAVASPPFGTSTSFETLLGCFVDAYADGKQEFVHGFPEIKSSLELRFQSHLYHLDLTFCLRVESLASLCGRQWLLHYLNVSHTNVRTTGLAEIASLQPLGRCAPPHRPLRVLVAEYCNVLNNLDGLQLFPCLTKLYVWNGSLDANGLSVFSSHATCFSNLIFLDLSYCDKVEDVSMLASLPSLMTLILDNTEISCDGIKGLSRCPVLRTLSLRFCPDFAPVGPIKERLDRMVVRIPTLQNYIYENLACDEVPREEAEDI